MLQDARVAETLPDALGGQKDLSVGQLVSCVGFLAAVRETRGMAAKESIAREDLLRRMVWVQRNKKEVWEGRERRLVGQDKNRVMLIERGRRARRH